LTIKRGFTLVELLVVILIFSLLMTGIAAFFMQIFKLKNRVIIDEKTINNLRIALYLVEKDIENIDIKSYLLFEGTENSIQFFNRNYEMIKFYVGSYQGKSNVLIKEVVRRLSKEGTLTDKVPIAFNVKDFKISYNSISNWEGVSKGGIPSIIKITLELNAGDKTVKESDEICLR